MAVPTLTHQGETAVLRDHPCQHRLRQVRSGISGIPVGDRKGLLIACRDLLSTACKAGGIKMVEAPVDAFAGAHAQGQFMKQQGAALGLGLIERAAELEAIEHLSPHAVLQHQLAGCIGKKLWGHRQGPMGKAEPIQNQAGHGFARREHFLWIGHQAGVNQVNYASIFADRCNDVSVVEAFHVNFFHG